MNWDSNIRTIFPAFSNNGSDNRPTNTENWCRVRVLFEYRVQWGI
jgi:hypothetical protein